MEKHFINVQATARDFKPGIQLTDRATGDKITLQSRFVRGIWRTKEGLVLFERDAQNFDITKHITKEELDAARLQEAEEVLYSLACETITSDQCKASLERLGFTVDLRSWRCNKIDLVDIETGDFVTAEV